VGAVFCEWGLNGIHALADRVDVFVIVDVLSFSTAVDVVVSRGASVYPFPFGDHERAKRAAAELGWKLLWRRAQAMAFRSCAMERSDNFRL